MERPPQDAIATIIFAPKKDSRCTFRTELKMSVAGLRHATPRAGTRHGTERSQVRSAR